MKYEPVYKFPEFSIFITYLFWQNYIKYGPIATIKNGKWEMFLSQKTLNEFSEKGYQFALTTGFFEKFKKEVIEVGKEVLELKDEKIEEMDKEQFLNFLDKLFDLAKRFTEKYYITEFTHFTKIEKELKEFIKDKISFQELLSGDVNIAGWPENKRKLADYIINMQHLKFELRKTANSVFTGAETLIPRTIQQLIIRTKRQDAPFMTLEELKDCLNGKQIKDVSDRAVYSYLTWEKGELNIISGGDAYRKIRELDKNIPKNEVIGEPACKGIVKGKVKIIPLSLNPEKYLPKMEKGDILVSDTTGPELMPAIEKAAAIVTDEGGMMSHAAVVSREFNLPCIVGTKYATKVFKDGDLIEVNAFNGIARKIDKI